MSNVCLAPEFGMEVSDIDDSEPAFAIGRLNHSEEERYMGMMKQQQFGELKSVANFKPSYLNLLSEFTRSVLVLRLS